MKTKFKKTLFYILMFVLPIFIWLSVETVLNMFTHRFEPLLKDGKKKTLHLNQKYFNDFFLYDLPVFQTTSTVNRAIHAEKGKRLRIFALGGSTTAGYPYNTFPDFNCPASFPNYLRAVLGYNPQIPEVEILNAGCNALSSLEVLLVFKDMVKYKPDIVIVYTGQNEFFGPNEFVLSKEKVLFYKNKTIYTNYLKLRRTYLYQGMKKLVRIFYKQKKEGHRDYLVWSRKNFVSPADEMNDLIRKQYRENIAEIVRIAKKEKIKLVLCAPVTNWTFPPFISRHRSDMTKDEIARSDSLDNVARTYFNEGKVVESIAGWRKMKAMDSTYADVSYHLGMAYTKLGRYEKAGVELEQSKNNDALPFRAKSFIGDICRETAQKNHVVLADVEKFFIDMSGRTYPTPTQLLDHVHPTETGYYYLALYLARVMLQNNIFPGITQTKYPSLQDCRRVLRIDPADVDQIEYEFPLGSYFDRLALLNPEISRYLTYISERARKRAEKNAKELLKK